MPNSNWHDAEEPTINNLYIIGSNNNWEYNFLSANRSNFTAVYYKSNR